MRFNLTFRTSLYTRLTALGSAVMFLLVTGQVNAAVIHLPDNVATTYFNVNDVSQYPGNTLISGQDFQTSPVLPISAAQSTPHLTVVTPTSGGGPFNVGDFSLFSSTSVDAGHTLHSYSAIQGSISSNLAITSDANSTYYDILTVSGPVTPTSVVFHVELTSNSLGLSGGTNWRDSQDSQNQYGYIDVVGINIDNNGNPSGGTGAGALNTNTSGGSTLTADITLPWAPHATSDGQLVFEVDLVGLGRVLTTGQADSVNLVVDLSARLTGVSLLDGATDITSTDTLSFASGQLAEAPEPSTWVLFVGLAALIAVYRGWRRNSSSRT